MRLYKQAKLGEGTAARLGDPLGRVRASSTQWLTKCQVGEMT